MAFLEYSIYYVSPIEALYVGNSALTTMPAPKITLIGIYFGRLPFYAPLFFKSAGANAGIDFFIITDRYPPCALPPNVRLLLINRIAFERLASEKLGHSMRLDSPRKLCDYKPAYGRIFSDYLRRSNYWGHIDFDIVWGNIPRFLHPAVEQGYEIISADGKRISGPCTIYKNTHHLRELFREIPDVTAKLNAPESFDLDERDFDQVVKSSGLSLLNRSFYSRRDIPFAEFRTFLADAESDSGTPSTAASSRAMSSPLPPAADSPRSGGTAIYGTACPAASPVTSACSTAYSSTSPPPRSASQSTSKII
jgi:hypothetical protein